MRRITLILTTILMTSACGMIEDSQDIPDSGVYTSIDDRGRYQSRLNIAKQEIGYDITLTEYSDETGDVTCTIEASGKKSSYGIWVEIPAYGPRLPIIIRKRKDQLEIALKGPDDPKNTFTYCLSDRTPAGTYQKDL